MKNVYSVSQINIYIKNMFRNDYALNNIYIKGEVSNCKYHTSGHIYFTLKDKSSVMACVMFAGSRSGLKFRMTEGQQVIALGSVSVYERDGKYQLYAKEIILDGAGLLHQKYEELKRQLEEQGYFDPGYKKAIPSFAKTVGIVTASTGAAVRDIINIAKRRNPYIQLVLYPAQVQGEGAAATIVKGIETLDRYGVDVIIAGRGGGSIEDLWAFNEAVVAKAIFACQTPIISAVGHETDVTIADFVADMRAPTPSAAAELAVPDIMAVLRSMDEYRYKLDMSMSRQLTQYKNRIDYLKMRLEQVSPAYWLQEKKQHLIYMEEKLEELMKRQLNDARHRLALDAGRLEAVSPLNRLSSGFAFVADNRHLPVKSIEQIVTGDTLYISLLDGEADVEVKDIRHQTRVNSTGGSHGEK